MQFRDFLKKQLEKDPEFKQFWLARNEMIFGRPVEAISLAEMDLSEKEKRLVLECIQSPEFKKRMNDLIGYY